MRVTHAVQSLTFIEKVVVTRLGNNAFLFSTVNCGKLLRTVHAHLPSSPLTAWFPVVVPFTGIARSDTDRESFIDCVQLHPVKESSSSLGSPLSHCSVTVRGRGNTRSLFKSESLCCAQNQRTSQHCIQNQPPSPFYLQFLIHLCLDHVALVVSRCACYV